MNNTQLFAIAIPFVILLGAIVAGAWLNQRGLERQMDAFRSEIKAEIGAFESKVRADIAILRAEGREERAPLRADIEQVKKTVEKIDRQLEAIVSRLILPK